MRAEELRRIPARLRNQFMRTRTGQRLAAPFGAPLAGKKWIFVLGSYNSGTTLLKDILATHPDIGALPGEGVRFTDALPRPEDFGWNRMWCRCLDQIRLLPGEGMEARAQRVKRQWSVLFPSGRPYLLEKSVANAVRTDFLQTYFSPAYFIYLVRNGYAVAEGIRRKANPAKYENPNHPSSYPIALCAEQWCATDRILMADSQHLERFLCLKYEELAAAPDSRLRTVTDFLGLDPLGDEHLHRPWQVHGLQSEIRDMNEGALERLSDEDIAQIREVAAEELDKYDYPAPAR